MVKQLKKSVDVDKMPSVRVRPTLKVEMKHRVMKCKLPNQSKDAAIDMDDLEGRVLK